MPKLRVQSFALSIGGCGLRSLGYECTKSIVGERATHVFLRRRP